MNKPEQKRNKENKKIARIIWVGRMNGLCDEVIGAQISKDYGKFDFIRACEIDRIVTGGKFDDVKTEGLWWRAAYGYPQNGDKIGDDVVATNCAFFSFTIDINHGPDANKARVEARIEWKDYEERSTAWENERRRAIDEWEQSHPEPEAPFTIPPLFCHCDKCLPTSIRRCL